VVSIIGSFFSVVKGTFESKFNVQISFFSYSTGKAQIRVYGLFYVHIIRLRDWAFSIGFGKGLLSTSENCDLGLTKLLL